MAPSQPSYLLMHEFQVHLMATSLHAIKDGGTAVDFMNTCISRYFHHRLFFSELRLLEANGTWYWYPTNRWLLCAPEEYVYQCLVVPGYVQVTVILLKLKV